ncbi:MAG: efflux RND transporter periplasmic adaptor subunit [Candidatus Omnitrophota bacterium]
MRNKKSIIIVMFLFSGLFLSFMHEIYAQNEKKARKVLYYRNPMNPVITSPTFMKDPMGMDYIPVYADQENADAGMKEQATIKVRESQQKLIGVKTEPVLSRTLMRMIRTVAQIAYDPELYKTETEFIQAVKLKEELKLGTPDALSQADALVLAAGLKLKLLGLSGQQIEELKTKTESDKSLIISDPSSPYSWVYIIIYEYDLKEVKTDAHVVLQAVAYPGKEFSGQIVALDPVLDANTRSVRARVKIDNPLAELKPNMYLDAFIHIDLGENLALPREAVLDTGIKKIVYIDLGKGEFAAREVEVGQEAIAIIDGQERGFFPVTKGVRESESVVTNGGFLIDSQSQLSGGMSALWGSASEIK